MPATDTPSLPQGEFWTLDDLEQLPEDGNRYEIANGSLLVSPAASFRHVVITHRLTRLLEQLAPPEYAIIDGGMGVEFPRSYYIPDIVVLRTPTMDLDLRALPAAEALLVVEVLSPWNKRNDLVLKRDSYGQSQIKQYWIVDPRPDEVSIAVLGADGQAGYTELATVKAGQQWVSDYPFPLAVDPADLG